MNKVTQRKNFKTISPKTETESEKKVKDSYKNTASIFLEIIQNLKNYVMEIMDMKIRQSQQPNPQMMFQQPYFPNQHTTPKHGSSTESRLLSKAVSFYWFLFPMDMKICQSQQPNPQMMFQQPYFPN